MLTSFFAEPGSLKLDLVKHRICLNSLPVYSKKLCRRVNMTKEECDPDECLVQSSVTNLADNCTNGWTWNVHDKSDEVSLTGDNSCTALFHPNWSNGSAGVRATRPLAQGCTYWEIRVSRRLFGTSLMFGIATAQARLHANSFLNLLGEDQHGWALSHKGYLFHNGQRIPYTKQFAENKSTTIGILFDSNAGTLTYFKDSVSLGLAFSGLHKVQKPLYAAICSTAARTEMTLIRIQREMLNLQGRCRSLILKITHHRAEKIDKLPLPRLLCLFLKEPLYLDGEIQIT